MPERGNVLEETRAYIEERLNAIEGERRKLERALAAVTDGRSGRRGPGRPRGRSAGSGSGSSGTRRRRRRRGGTRADQAVKLVDQNPGISASDIARRMSIKPNYLYRVMSDLEKEGRVTKRGREYHPAG
ncbi:MAG TPA: winged helix-turn-helix transcriptional regulator [Solirubrobacterales bacterium]|nr:winged helix-turn-helix transcriptional regulator [Solirubrobacterales bacterium]